MMIRARIQEELGAWGNVVVTASFLKPHVPWGVKKKKGSEQLKKSPADDYIRERVVRAEEACLVDEKGRP